MKAGRHHADHGVRRAVDDQRSTEHIRFATEYSLPVSVAEDHDLRRALLRLLGPEPSPQLRLHAERAQEIDAHDNAGDPFRGVAAGDRVGPAEPRKRGE
jgi:hypothetical protein